MTARHAGRGPGSVALPQAVLLSPFDVTAVRRKETTPKPGARVMETTVTAGSVLDKREPFSAHGVSATATKVQGRWVTQRFRPSLLPLSASG
jgi:hypothetical protein